jgi:hypothetical protein
MKIYSIVPGVVATLIGLASLLVSVSSEPINIASLVLGVLGTVGGSASAGFHYALQTTVLQREMTNP